jgi:hypothetical protein
MKLQLLFLAAFLAMASVSQAVPVKENYNEGSIIGETWKNEIKFYSII